MRFEQMDTDEKISYLRDCLPLKPFEETVGEKERSSEEDIAELIDTGKRVIQKQMQQGRDHWNYLIEQQDIEGEEFFSNLSYREILYYSVSMEDANLETYPSPFYFHSESRIKGIVEERGESVEDLREELLTTASDSVVNAFSEVGSNIWDRLSDQPTLRFATFEDKCHLFLEFWVKTRDKTRFHERRGEFLSFPEIRKLSCRVHLDDGFAEIRGRNEREKDRKAVKNAIEHLLRDQIRFLEDEEVETDGGQPLEITDETIRGFYELDEFVTVPHASKSGTARSSWTSDDVRDDDRYPDDRPNNYNNLVFDLDDIGRISFQLSAEDNSFRIFKQLMVPEDHRTVVEYIWGKINEINRHNGT